MIKAVVDLKISSEDPPALADLILTILWIEGFKVAPLEDSDG